LPSLFQHNPSPDNAASAASPDGGPGGSQPETGTQRFWGGQKTHGGERQSSESGKHDSLVEYF